MRDILKVLHRYNHPVSLLTKSASIIRDLDLLQPMAQAGTVRAMLSITTLDHKLARAMEPRASTPKKRFDAIRRLSDAGVPVGVMTAPIIPGLNDSELEGLLDASKEAGAQFVGYTIIRLPLEVADLFEEWLKAVFPDRAARIMRHIRDLNGGKIYDVSMSRSQKPKSVYSKLIASRFEKACARLDLTTTRPKFNDNLFRRPLDNDNQLSLF